MKNELTQARLRELLHYDPESGLFTRCNDTTKNRAGSVVGHVNHGYVRARIESYIYEMHRLAWLYVTGRWPDGEIDHINGTRSDNRWCNLRDVPRRLNNENLRRAKINNMTGFLGVTKHVGGKWQARIRVKGKAMFLGSYAAPEEAHQAYLTAKRAMHAACSI